MYKVNVETDRIIITSFDPNMAKSVQMNSLDEDNRCYMSDEVFETEDEARATILSLLLCYESDKGPLVFPVLLKDGQQIGHVETMPIGQDWEIGFHIGKTYTGKGYATEATKAFLPVIMTQLGLKEIYGICHVANTASRRVLQKCGFLLEFECMGPCQGKIQQICRYKLMA